MVDVVPLDQRPIAVPEDFDAQPGARWRQAGTGDGVIANDQIGGAVVGQDSAAAGVSNRVADNLGSRRAVSQSDAGSPLRGDADVGEIVVDDAVIRHSLEVDSLWPEAGVLREILDSQIVNVLAMSAAAVDSLGGERVAIGVERETGQFHVAGGAQRDHRVRGSAAEGDRCIVSARSYDLDAAFRLYRSADRELARRHGDRVARLGGIDGGSKRRKIIAVIIGDGTELSDVEGRRQQPGRIPARERYYRRRQAQQGKGSKVMTGTAEGAGRAQCSGIHFETH